MKTLCPYVLSTCDASNECVAWSAIDTNRFVKDFLCITPATSTPDLNKRQPRLQKDFGNIDMIMVAKMLDKKFGDRMPLTLQVARHVFEQYPKFVFCDTASVHANVAVFVLLC